MRAVRRALPVNEGGTREPEHIASVLLNTGAGGGRAGQAATLRQIRDAFAGQGWASEIVCIPPQRFAGEAPLRVRDARGVVVAAGGDGTVNIIANACRAHRRPMGLLPLGNANLAARALGLEPGLEQAVVAVAAGRPAAVRYAELNGRLFLSDALFGLYPALLGQRRPGAAADGWRGRAAALASGLRMLARTNAPFEAVLEARAQAGAAVGAERMRATTMQVTLDLQPGMAAEAAVAGCIDRGGLVLAGLARHARWPTLNALLSSALGRYEPARGGIAACASRIVIHTRRRQVPVWMDGDLRLMEPPLEFRVRDSGLQVVRLPQAGPSD